MAKLQIFSPSHRIFCTPLWLKNLLQIALSITVFKIFTPFDFPQKSKRAAKSWPKIEIFPLHIGYFVLPCGSKIRSNLLYFKRFFEIFTLFHYPLTSKMVTKSDKKCNFSTWIGNSCSTLWVKDLLEIALSPTVFEIFTLFHLSTKIQDSHQKWQKFKFSPLDRKLLYYPMGQKFARISLSHAVFEIFTPFHFPQNSKMATRRDIS